MDAITFAVVKSALDAIVDEMAYTVIRTARSEIVKDVMDFSAALCDASGTLVAQAKTIAQHLGAVPDAMASVLAQFGDDLHAGDVVIMNDPYEGGMHLPDVFMFMPIALEGRRQGFAVVIAHQTDMGGRVPGSNASDSTEIYQATGPPPGRGHHAAPLLAARGTGGRSRAERPGAAPPARISAASPPVPGRPPAACP